MLRRKLAALLAGAMVLTSLPMVSFAKTDNHIDKVPVVADDTNFYTDGLDVPELTIKQDPDKIAGETFKLEFDNAKWKAGDGSKVVGGVTHYTYRKITDTTVEFKIADPAPTNSDSKESISIPMFVEMGDAGDAKVTVNPVDSTLSAGTYTFAIAGSGDTTMSIEDVENIDDSGDIKPITIDETKIGAIAKGTQTFKLKLPSHFTWKTTAADNKVVVFSGGLTGATLSGATPVDINDRELEITFNAPAGREARGTITIDNVEIVADSDANYGDVDVKISGDEFTSQTITVANYVDYGMTIEADGDPEALIAGRWEADADDEVFELQKLVLKEDIENSWLADRKTKVEFPDGVKIRGYKVTKADKFDDKAAFNVDTLQNKTAGNMILDSDLQYVEFTGDITKGEKAELNIKFYVSVEPDFTGDVVATVSGRSLPSDEEEVVLGTVTAPITATVDVKDVRIGRQNEEIGTITIAETESEAIKKGDITVALDSYFEWNSDPDVEVTEGDLEIKDVETDGNLLTITVDGDSRTASTIEITGGKVDLNRVIPEGEFKLEVGGNAIVQNNETETKLDKDDDAVFDKDYVVKTVFANVVTPNVDDLASGAASAQKASFTVGAADYTVGTEVASADAAPYIKDGRTMIPVKYAAYALGVDPANVKWDQATKTVTILGDRVIQITIGSKDLKVNGAVLTMDVAAEVQDGRSYLPISWIASALNVPYSWDAATKTVTFN